jgi:hypothetical protein
MAAAKPEVTHNSAWRPDRNSVSNSLTFDYVFGYGESNDVSVSLKPVRPNRKSKFKMAAAKPEVTHNSACRPDRNSVSNSLTMFSGIGNLTMLPSNLSDLTGSPNSRKRPPNRKPHITQLVGQIGTPFQILARLRCATSKTQSRSLSVALT